MRRKLDRVGKGLRTPPPAATPEPKSEEPAFRDFVITSMNPASQGAWWVSGHWSGTPTFGARIAVRRALYSSQGVRMRAGDDPLDVDTPLALPPTFVRDFQFRFDDDPVTIQQPITDVVATAPRDPLLRAERDHARDQRIREAERNTADLDDDRYEIEHVRESRRIPEAWYVQYSIPGVLSTGHFYKDTGENTERTGSPRSFDPDTLQALYADAYGPRLRMLPKPPERINLVSARRVSSAASEPRYIIEGYYGEPRRRVRINYELDVWEGTYDMRGQLIRSHGFTVAAPPRVSLRDAGPLLERS